MGTAQSGGAHDGATGATLRLDGYPRVRLLCPGGTELEAAVADTFARRFLGLAWLAEPPPIALLIPRCASVHTIGMRFDIDVAFMQWPPERGPSTNVLAVSERLRPVRTAAVPRRSRTAPRSRTAALELAAGQAAALAITAESELRAVARP